MTSGSSRRSGNPERALARLARAALAEDLGRGDITSRVLVPPSRRASASIVAKAPGVLAGLAAAAAVFRAGKSPLKFQPLLTDGSRVGPGRRVAALAGPLREILARERVALNLLCRLSGIATLTSRFVALARPFGVAVLDTRKTTPLLRDLEKGAVRAGGGVNHRRDLGSAVLVKDNHIAAAGGLARAVARARGRTGLPVEVEAQSPDQVRAAVESGADVIMLDNLPPAAAARAIRFIRRRSRAKVEISGGVTLRSVGRLAALKPDYISTGALTHSAPALDFSLDVMPEVPSAKFKGRNARAGS